LKIQVFMDVSLCPGRFEGTAAPRNIWNYSPGDTSLHAARFECLVDRCENLKPHTNLVVIFATWSRQFV
jgi:hypothetical protein